MIQLCLRKVSDQKYIKIYVNLHMVSWSSLFFYIALYVLHFWQKSLNLLEYDTSGPYEGY